MMAMHVAINGSDADRRAFASGDDPGGPAEFRDAAEMMAAMGLKETT